MARIKTSGVDYRIQVRLGDDTGAVLGWLRVPNSPMKTTMVKLVQRDGGHQDSMGNWPYSERIIPSLVAKVTFDELMMKGNPREFMRERIAKAIPSYADEFHEARTAQLVVMWRFLGVDLATYEWLFDHDDFEPADDTVKVWVDEADDIDDVLTVMKDNPSTGGLLPCFPAKTELTWNTGKTYLPPWKDPGWAISMTPVEPPAKISAARRLAEQLFRKHHEETGARTIVTPIPKV